MACLWLALCVCEVRGAGRSRRKQDETGRSRRKQDGAGGSNAADRSALSNKPLVPSTSEQLPTFLYC